MRDKGGNRTMYSVSCGCGASISLDARAFGAPRPCPACKGSVVVAWGEDEKGKSTPVVVHQTLPPGQMKIQKSERPKPTSPALPSHLRVPLRVRLAPDAKFFDCPCGERNLLRSGWPGRSVQCPSCDRLHIVEAQGAAAPPDAPPAAAEAPTGSRPLRMGEFLCKCREIQPPRTSRTGKNFECKSCGRKGTVEFAKDAEGKDVVRPTFTYEPPAPPPKVEAARPPAGGGDPAWTCPCGTGLDPRAALLQGRVSCPGCGRSVRLEKAQRPHSKMTLFKPVFADDPAVVFEELELEAPTADCDCGAALQVSTAEVGTRIQCPVCGTVSVIEAAGKALRLRTVGP